jgi:hypothetical protein
VIERANQVDPAGAAQPEPRAESPAVTGRTGVRYALVGMLIVIAWLVLCLFLRRVF